MLRPGADARRAVRRARSVRRVGRSDAHRFGRVPGVLARSEDRRRRGDVQERSTTARRTVSPRRSRSTCSSARRRHPDGARRVPTACRATPDGHPVGRRADQRLGGPGACRPRAARPVAVRHRAGRCERGDARGERPPHRRGRTSTGTASAGLSVGETREQMLPALAAALAELPTDQPRVPDGRRRPGLARRGGGARRRPVRLRDADATRPARHGAHVDRSLPGEGRPNAELDEPLDADCSCDVCARHSRGYIRHLLQVGEPTASRLLSIHNVAWTIQLMDRMRAAIVAGTFDQLRRDVLAVWG